MGGTHTQHYIHTDMWCVVLSLFLCTPIVRVHCIPLCMAFHCYTCTLTELHSMFVCVDVGSLSLVGEHHFLCGTPCLHCGLRAHSGVNRIAILCSISIYGRLKVCRPRGCWVLVGIEQCQHGLVYASLCLHVHDASFVVSGTLRY